MKGKMKKGILYGIGILISVVFCVFLVWGICYPVQRFDLNAIDDQRSTLWPLLISLVITMLGSLITTYVFLKEALDRTIDEKPYYRKVVKKYREETMEFLWDYSVGCLFLIVIVVLIYVLLYFGKVRMPVFFRMALCVLYVLCMAFSGGLLYKCIHIDKGIHQIAKQSRIDLENKVKQDRNTDMGREKGIFLNEFVKQLSRDCTLEQWLQVEEVSFGNRERFVNRFSEWEKFLLLLADRTQGFISEQSMEQNIRVTLMHGEMLLDIIDAEKVDAEENKWNGTTYKKLKKMQDALSMNWESFSACYNFLSEYRNLLQVQKETSQENNRFNQCPYLSISEENDAVIEIFAEFLLQFSLRYLKMIPRIELFFPSGKFQFADFYNVRIENSSFRSSLFENVVFARVKMQNSNLGMSKFENVEFYSADIRDCSWNNCLFLDCNLDASIWNNADLTGTTLKKVCVQDATFENVILSNIEFQESKIKNTLFINSKLWDVDLYNLEENSLYSCNFTDSDLKNVKIWSKKIPSVKLNKNVFDYATVKKLDETYYLKDTKSFDMLIKKWFIFNENPFRYLCVFKNTKNRNQYEEWFVWKQIQQLCFFNIKEAIFSRAKLERVPFYRIDFSQSVFNHTQMNEGVLIACNLAGCVMEHVGLRGATLNGVHMGSTVLKEGVLFNTNCSLVNFQDSNLISLHASGAKMEYCTFERSDCSEIDLTKAVIKFSSFRDGILNKAELTSSEFEDVILDNCIADSMLSSYTRFCQCTFHNAFLKLSSFNYTVFKKCEFKLANFSESTVTGAEFCKCDFLEANFRNTIFIDAIFKDNENIKEEIFEGCTFMDTVFEGKDKKWEKIFRKNNTIKMRYSV